MRSLYVCALLALGACDSDEDIDCSYQACGGDPVGTWNIDGACAPTGGNSEQCPGSMLVQSASYSGTWTFDADMTYRAEGLSLVSLQGSFPTSCLTDQTDCEDLAEAGLTCQTTGDLCECQGVTSAPFDLSGSWTSSGEILAIDGVEWAYCRSAGSLKMTSVFSGETLVLSN